MTPIADPSVSPSPLAGCLRREVAVCGADGQYATTIACASPTPYCETDAAACVECTSAIQCAPPNNPCLAATCTGNACGLANQPNGTACTSGTDGGACQAGACTVCTGGAIRCKPGAANLPQTCVSGQWLDSSQCGVGTPVCSGGQCVACINANQCPQAASPCQAATCNSGSCSLANQPNGTPCVVAGDSGSCGSGTCAVCTNGATRCSPTATNVPQACANGTWIDGIACSASQVCVTGSCTSAPGGTGTQTDPGTSCKGILGVKPMSASGVYWLDVDASGPKPPFQAYCDMSMDLGGWTLIAHGGMCSSIGAVDALTGQQPCSYLPFTVVQALASMSSDVRLTAGGAFGSWTESAQSLSTKAVEALMVPTGNWHNGTTWATTWTFSAVCDPSWATGWPNMYQSCGVGSGVHWVTNNATYFHQPRSNAPQPATATWVR